MNRNCLLNKILAMLLCAVLLIGYLPVSALPAAAATDDKWESEKDVLETTTEAPTEPETTVPEVEETTAPEAGEVKEYKMAMNKNGTMLYFNGSTESASVNYRLATTENEAEAVSVFLEPVAGGYHLYFMNGGVKTYIRVYERQDGNPGYGKGSLELVTTAPAEILTMDETTGTLFYTADDGENAYYMGTYSTYTTFSVSNTFYITGSNAGNVDVSQYPARFYEVITEPETTEPETTEPTPGSDEMHAIFLGEMENTVTNAGSLWYQGYFSGTVMTVTGQGEFSVTYGGEDIPAVDGAVSVPVSSPNPRMPVTFVLNGTGEYTIKFVYPEGTQMNPAELVLGYNDTAIEAGNNQGYYYKWTATETGTLAFNIESITEGVEADIVINNNTTYANRTLYADGVENDFGVMVVSMPVTAGDEIVVQITVMPDESWNYPAADINHYSEFIYPVGSEMNPVLLLETANMVTNVGTMYYSGYFSGMAMTVAGEGEFSVIYNGETLPSEDGCVWTLVSAPNPRMPVTFAIVGDGDYTITFAYPVGTMMNPAGLILGYNDTAIEAGNNQGYYYKWTATETGTLAFNIETITEGVEADIIISNNTSYLNRTLQADGVENDFGVMVVFMPVTAGDEIVVQIAVMPDEGWNYPAADINHYSEFIYPVGSEMNPVWLYDQENTVMVTAGDTVYYQGYFSGMNLTVSGETGFAVVYGGENLTDIEGAVSTAVSAPGFRMPVVFAITNNTDSQQTYSIKFAHPVGSFENPAAAVLGDNTCSIEAGNSQGYFWTYTAEQTGNLNVEIKAQTGWSYVVNNMTTYQYGDTQWSDSDPVVNPATIAVNQGDEIQIIVNTYDPNAENPAGDITVNLSYKQPAQPEVELANPGLRLALESDLSAGFTVKPAMFADGAYTDLRMEFRLGDENAEPVVVTDYITLSNGDRVYMFDGIAPRMLNETIYATLYGTYMGTEYSVSVSTSIYAYCNWALSGNDAKLKKLVVDLMNYASAHQIYGNYKTDTLANRNLSPEQQALGTQTDPARTNITNASQVVIANPTASFTGAALYLQNKVEIRFTFSVPALTENTRLVVEVDGQKVTYGADKFVATGNKYYVDVDALAAKQMRSAVDATLYEGNTAISNTLRYSIESFVAYAYGREGFSTEALDAMMIAMLKYGDSANAFFN